MKKKNITKLTIMAFLIFGLIMGSAYVWSAEKQNTNNFSSKISSIIDCDNLPEYKNNERKNKKLEQFIYQQKNNCY